MILPCLCPTKSSRRLISLHCVACLSTSSTQVWRPRSSRGEERREGTCRPPDPNRLPAVGTRNLTLSFLLSKTRDYKVLSHRGSTTQQGRAKKGKGKDQVVFSIRKRDAARMWWRDRYGVHDDKVEHKVKPSSKGVNVGAA